MFSLNIKRAEVQESEPHGNADDDATQQNNRIGSL